MTPEEVLERFYYKGWNKADTSVLVDLVDENVKFQAAFGRRLQARHHCLSFALSEATRQDLTRYTLFEIKDMIVSKDETRAHPFA